MKKLFLILFVSTAMLGQALAQDKADTELQKLMNTVATLRNVDSKAWDKALANFEKDDLWTMMDETKRHDNECWLVGDNRFKLNEILSKGNHYDKKATTGDFLNGNDPNFNYSLIERGVKKNSKVTYELSYREGRQTFVVMPYEKNIVVEVNATRNGTKVGSTRTDTDGNVILTIDDNVKTTDKLVIEIANKSDKDMAVVIINHNTRKP